MKKELKQIAAVLMVLAAVLNTGCVDQAYEMTADQIADRMNAKQASIKDFSSRMVMATSFGGENTTMQVLMMTKQPDKSRFEYIEPAELAGMVMVTNGSTMWRYDPARNRVTKMELREAECGPFDMDYTEIIKSLLNETDLSYEGTEIVNGRSAYVLNITPRAETELVRDITNTRAWVDCENWMLLGMEMYDLDGNLAVKAEYRNITFNTGILDSEFIFEVPEDAVVVEESFEDRMPQEMTLEEAENHLAFDMKTPSYLPDGCEFDHAVVFGENRVSLTYKNGSEFLQISEWVSDAVYYIEQEISYPEVVSINGIDGEFGSVFGINTLRWSADGIEYSLSGTIMKEEMLRVAESARITANESAP
ncbi:MAG: outer membrane lipoprotein-sorting protein [Euryarchaeota archaeon]|nr:outer membrane lipoprotein-sorting protein [Euryarchaeota archaeon]